MSFTENPLVTKLIICFAKNNYCSFFLIQDHLIHNKIFLLCGKEVLGVVLVSFMLLYIYCVLGTEFLNYWMHSYI